MDKIQCLKKIEICCNCSHTIESCQCEIENIKTCFSCNSRLIKIRELSNTIEQIKKHSGSIGFKNMKKIDELTEENIRLKNLNEEIEKDRTALINKANELYSKISLMTKEVNCSVENMKNLNRKIAEQQGVIEKCYNENQLLTLQLMNLKKND